MKAMSVKGLSIGIGIVVVAGMLLFAGTSGFSSLQKQSEEKEATTVKKITVGTQVVKSVEKASNLHFKATLEPSEEGVVTGSLSGKAVKILFKEGDRVGSGTPLVMIDDREYKTQLRTSEINLKKLQIANLALKKEAGRVKELMDSGSATTVELEDAQRAVDVNELEIESTKASIDGTNNTLSNTIVRSPLAGVVDDKEIKIGQFVSPGMIITKVKNISTLNAIVQIDQTTARQVKVGQTAKLMVEGVKEPVMGKVTYMDVSANPETRTFKCKIQIENSKYLLKPGVYAVVEIENTGVRDVVTVPVKAMMGNEDQYFVFVNAGGTAKKVLVTIGAMNSDTVDVVAGLKAGDEIVVTNLTVLQDGDPIQVGASTAKGD